MQLNGANSKMLDKYSTLIYTRLRIEKIVFVLNPLRKVNFNYD